MPGVNVKYDHMDTVGRNMGNTKNEIEQKLVSMKNQVDALIADGYVTDASSKQFHDRYDQFNNGAKNVLEGLAGMGQFLGAASQAFQQTDDQLKTQLSQV